MVRAKGVHGEDVSSEDVLSGKERVYSLEVSHKHVVDDGHELHDPLIQVEVLQSFEEVRVLSPVRAHHGYLLGFGLGGEHHHVQIEALQHDGLISQVLQTW